MNDQSLSETALQSILDQFPVAERYLVAFSGGLDSTVLLYLMHRLCCSDNKPLLALHVNHGLNPAADDWSEHCRSVCRELVVELEVMTVDISDITGQSPEEAARTARYAVLEKHTAPGDILLTAHQLDDQAETLLLQLMRGAGPEGLAAMPAVKTIGKGLLARPLLVFRRDAIRQVAEREGLHWIEDDSNMDIRFDRNFIRSRLMPLLEQRWPSVSMTLARAARHQADAREILREVATDDHSAMPDLPASQLDIDLLGTLSRPRAANLVRYWLNINGVTPPSSAVLEQLLNDVVSAAPDAMPCIRWQGAEVRRYQQRLYVMSPLSSHDPGSVYTWNPDRSLVLPCGTLTATAVTGDGISKNLLGGRSLDIRFRQGGESIRPAGQAHRRDLKKLFQEAAVPPWVRDRIPLLYDGDTLVSVAGYWIDDACRAQKNEPGWQVQFEPAD